MPEEMPGYYAVIPANVRYDPELRPNAKLLYGELTALAGADGYCWATDKYFASLFGLSVKTVNELVQSLARRGYIRVEKGANSRGVERHIYAGIFIDAGGIPKKTDTPKNVDTPEGGYPEKSGEGYPDFSGTHKDSNLNNLPEIPPKAPQGGQASAGEKPRRRREAKKAPDWEPEMFALFWKAYPRGEDRQGAIAEWDRLKPDRALMERMGEALRRQTASADWRRGIGIPYAVRWLRHRRWEYEEKDAPPDIAEGSGGYIPEISETWD